MNTIQEINKRLGNIESLLIDIKSKPDEISNQKDQDEFFTVAEAAGFLKFSVTTMYNLIHEKRIPFMKSRKRCYFLKADLVKYLKQGRQKSLNETASEADQYLEK